MIIDWFTVVAQMINFLVLVALLKRFLYRPILTAIDRREQVMAQSLADAQTLEQDARREQALFQQKNTMFELEQGARLAQAVTEAQAERRRLIDAARQEVADLRQQWLQALAKEAEQLHGEIRRRTQIEVLATVRRVLSDLASARLEGQVIELFVRRLQTLEGVDRDQLGQALAMTDCPILLRSAYVLDPEDVLMLEQTLTTLGMKQALQLMVVPELVSGVELLCGGYKLAWSIADYLASLEVRLSELWHEQA